MADICRATVRISGTVQGVGFRPFVYRTAVEAGVSGHVRNAGETVEAAFEGGREAVVDVVATVRDDTPPLATVETIDVDWGEPVGDESFEIRDSAADASGGIDVPVPPDTGICEACLDDVRDPASPYHDYWATACVDCGPRFTVVRDVPYDRTRTSMADFPLCEGCRERYEMPTDRRYHAQTTACPDCGPTLRYDGGDPVRTGREALQRAGAELSAGGIVAVKGIGGFHLVCDATDPAVVDSLREHTGRPAKPFACMVPSLDSLRAFAAVDAAEAAALTDVRRPIVLLDKAAEAPWLDAVAPGLDTLGVMLPYAGLHHLLFDYVPGPLVMTSANRPGEPMCTTADAVWSRLDGVVDGVLSHDREIVARCDDSVVRVVDGDERFVRRSRGWTPTTLPNPAGDDGETAPVVALGPERDATVALATGEGVLLSQHLGDIDGPEALSFHRAAVDHLCRLTDIEPRVVACDQHPEFLTTAEADSYAADGLDGPVAVQHHHAHAAGLCAEHGLKRAIVVTADGTGYGPDGTVWGGEVLDVRYADFERVGGLGPFSLPGGRAAVEYPARVLAGLLDSPIVDDRLVETGAVDSRREAAVVRQQAERGVNAPTTTSAGRVLDAVSALVGACDRRTYEGEPAQRLEALATNGTVRPIDLQYRSSDGRRVLDTHALVSTLADMLTHRSAADVAATAQAALARGLGTLAVEAASERDVSTVGFTGGVAYNDAISRHLRDVVTDAGLTYLTPDAVPPGDGGIAYGQAIVASSRSNGSRD